MSDLDLLGERDEVVPQGFTVDTPEKAEWALRKKGSAQAEIDRMEVYASALKHRIDERLAEVTKAHRTTAEYMDVLIRPWAEIEIAKAGGKKSVKLLSGTVGYRHAPASLVVNDDVKAVAWLEEHSAAEWGECVRVKKEVKKAEVKKLIESTGEIPDGVELKPGDIRFYAEPLTPALESK